jgi:hypothetical protein
MKKKYFEYFTILLFFGLSCINKSMGQTNVLTQHNNNTRAGLNNHETLLTTSNVNTTTFGKLFTLSVDDQVYAQPLVYSKLNIGGRFYNAVFIATVNNSIYAYDGNNGNLLWNKNYTVAGDRPPKNTDMLNGNYHDFTGNIGIVGTPVIDSATQTMYFVARSTDGTNFYQYLHAINIVDGSERTSFGSPVLITASVPGTGGGSKNNVVSFDPRRGNQRCALTLVNGTVYVAYSSHGDWQPYHGWLLGYDAGTLQQKIVYNTTPNGQEAAIWECGMGISADASGNLYVVTGNGTVGTTTDPTNPINRGESAMKLVPNGNTLTIASYFTPNTYLTLNSGDKDYGCMGSFLLPNSNTFFTGAKDGNVYVLDKDNMGGYSAAANQNKQTILLTTNTEIHGQAAYYKGSNNEFAYVWGEKDVLHAFPFDRGSNTFGSPTNSTAKGPNGGSGAVLSVSSNGTTNGTGIVWAAYAPIGDAGSSTRPGILRAFDANDVTKELWNNTTVSSDNAGNYAKFSSPTIANGHVYLPTFSNQVVAYGLKPGKSASLIITGNNQTIVYGSTLPKLTYTVTGFVNGDDTTVFTTPVTISTTATATSGVGTYPITVSAAVAANYTITFVAGTLTITAAPLTITADSLTKKYGDNNPNLNYKYAGFVNNENASVLTTPVAISTTATVTSGVGIYPITVSGATAANYTITFVAGTLTINQATLTITADNQTKNYGDNNPTLTYKYTGFVNGDDTTKLITPVSISTTAIVTSPVGNYPITVSGATAANYVITFVAGTLTINQTTLTITADNQTKNYGDNNPTLTYKYAGFVNGDDATKLITPVSISTTAIVTSPVGNFPITVSGATAANYAITFVAGTLTINQAPLTITADNQTKNYGDNNPTLTYKYTGFVNGDDATKLITPVSISTTAIVTSPVGNYPISISGATATNYAITFVAGTLTINQATLTITADNQTKNYGDNNPTLTYKYTGFVNGDDATKLTTPVSISTTAVITSSVGNYPISISGATATNYAITFVAGTLTINQAPLTITADNLSKNYSDSNPPLTYKYAGFVNNEDATVLITPVNISTIATTNSAAGTYPIAVSGATAANYAITFVAGTLTINPAPAPTITAADNLTVTAGSTVNLTGTYFLDATAVSFGGTAASSFTVNSATSITAVVGNGASGNIVVTTPTGSGSFSGFNFVPVPIVTASGPTTILSDGNGVTLTANPANGGFSYQWQNNGVNIKGATNATYNTTQTGNYAVIITLNGVSQTSVAIPVTAVYALPATNFTLTITSETCIGSGNSTVVVTAVANNNYIAVLTGNGVNITQKFTTNTTFGNLTAGSYTLTLTVDGQANYSTTYAVVVTQPKPLSVYATVNNALGTINLALSGGAVYHIQVNNKTYTTTESSFTVPLESGNNALQVTTDRECQGIFSKLINPSLNITPYPIPFESTLNLNLGSDNIEKVSVRIYSTNTGTQVYTADYQNQSGVLQLDLSKLAKGVYSLHLKLNNNQQEFKIVK